MIIFLYGPDSYRRKQKLDGMISEYQKKHSNFAVRHCDLSEEGAAVRLRELVSARSLFDSLQLVVAHNFESVLEDDVKELKSILKNASNDKSFVLILESNKKPSVELKFLLQMPVQAQEFESFSGKHLEDFIKIEAARVGVRLTPTLLAQLVETYVGDSWGVITELQAFAVKGESGREIIGVGEPENIFNILTDLKRAPVRSAIPILERLLLTEDPAKLFNLLVYQADVNSKRAFADYDVAVKSGKLDYEAALTEYVLDRN